MTIHTVSTKRPSWRGIFAGLLMGLVVSMTMLALALVLSSFLSLDLRGAGIAAGVYAAITALLSAFVAGFVAVKASAPEVLFGDGTNIAPKDATLTGILTAAAIVVISSVFAMNSISGVVKTAGSAVGSTASAIGGAAGSVVSTASTVAGMSAAATDSDNTLVNKAQELYQKATGNISRQDIEAWVAKNNDTFDQAQITATVNVLEDMLNKTKADLAEMDFSSIDTWKNIDEYAKQRAGEIETVLKGDELITRLQAEGLTQAQALQVREESLAAYNDYRASTEQAVADAKLKMEQTLQSAEQAARKAALYSGLFWLISTLLTFVASIAGAKKAAATYRFGTPVVVRDKQ